MVKFRKIATNYFALISTSDFGTSDFRVNFQADFAKRYALSEVPRPNPLKHQFACFLTGVIRQGTNTGNFSYCVQVGLYRA